MEIKDTDFEDRLPEFMTLEDVVYLSPSLSILICKMGKIVYFL